jgi:hypothetical protein
MPNPTPPRNPPNGNQATRGALKTVPCPWCGALQDFSPHVGEELGSTGWGNQALEVGAFVDCDKCDRTSKVIAIDRPTIITLAPARKA